MSRLDDLLLLEDAGELPPDLQGDLDTLRAAGEVPPREAPPSGYVETFMRRTVQPIVESGKRIGKLALEATAGPGGLQRAAEKVGESKVQTAVDALTVGGAVAAPVATLALGALGSAAEETARKVGASEGVASAIGTAAELAPAAVAVGKIVKAGVGRFARGAAEVAEDVAKPAATVADVAADEGAKLGAATREEAVQLGLFDDTGHVRPSVVEASGATIVEGATPRAAKELVGAVKAEGQQAAELLAQTEAAANKQRLYLQVSEVLEKRAKEGTLDAAGLIDDIEARGLSMPEYIRDYLTPSVSRGARIMQVYSSLAQELAKRPGMEEAVGLLRKANKTNRVFDFLDKLNDTRRALLITQVRTGVRNAITQGGTATVDLLEAGLTGGVTGMRDHLDSLVRAANRTDATAEVDRLLRFRSDLRGAMGKFEYSAPELIDDVPVLRATVGKLTEWTTAVNRWQEMFFRHAKFNASIRQELRRRGLDLSLVNDTAKLDELGILDKAVENALTVTFAAERPGGLNTAMTGIPKLLVTSILPFPRYMANAAVFVAKRNPLGLVRLATQHGRQNARQVMAEAATGTALLGGALALRYSPYAGEKWYEWKPSPDSDKRYDIRGFAGPFAAYAFLGEAIRRKLETGRIGFEGTDWIEGTLSMNRMAGTAATMLSWMKGDLSDKKTQEKFESLVGDWIGGFATPAANIKDALVLAGRDEGGVLRDTKESPLLGPGQAKLPIAGESLPPRISITTGEPIATEAPFLQGVLGLNVRSVNAVEKEMGRLGIALGDIAPKTGIPKADRELYRRVGKIVSALGPKVIETEAYARLSPAEQTLAIKGLFKNAKAMAREHLKATNPRLDAAITASDKLTGDKRRLLEERGVDVGGILQRFVDQAPEAGKPAQAATPPAPPAAPAAEPTSEDMIGDVATVVGIDPKVVRAVVAIESGGNPGIEGPVTPHSGGQRAQGLMQLLPSTFEEMRPEVEAILGREADISNPVDNLVAGSLLYKRLLAEHGDLETAARFYHGGPNTRIHGEKTRKYGRLVAARAGV